MCIFFLQSAKKTCRISDLCVKIIIALYEAIYYLDTILQFEGGVDINGKVWYLQQGNQLWFEGQSLKQEVQQDLETQC